LKTFHLLYHLARADFLERIRRHSFLVTVAFTIYLSYTFLPAADAGYKTVALGNYRGIYNSAWVGSAMAMMGVVFLSLIGFYLVKNAVVRDEQTGVGQILASAPLSSRLYLLGKTLSNFAVLSSVVLVLALVSILMQLLRGEDYQVNLSKLLAPLLLISLPVMAVVSGLAALFESVRFLKGGFGNVVYYFFWNGLIASILIPRAKGDGGMVQTVFYDLFGITIPIASMMAAAKTAFPDYVGSFRLGYSFDLDAEKPAELATFRWEGIDWTPEIILSRLAWAGLAFGLPLFASLFFNRFDSFKKELKGTLEKETKPESEIKPGSTIPILLTPLPAGAVGSNWVSLFKGELRLMAKGVRWWWLAVAGGLIAAGLLAPLNVVRMVLLPAAWIWPLFLWSPMGTKETCYRTDQLLFSTPFPLKRQLPALWAAGFIVTLLTGAGAGAHFLLAGDPGGFWAWLVGVLFIPSLALTLGVWSGSGKLFEVIYLMIWYVGPVNKFPFLDFMGVTPQAIASDMPLIFLLISAILLVLAVAGRKKQLQI